jgi:hypothetical protein
MFRLNNPKLYGELLPTAIKNPVLQDIVTVLPLRDQFGRRIVVIEIGKISHVVFL